MKRLLCLTLAVFTLLTCASCGQPENQVPDIEPQLSQMKSICELSVMECYYHNVAKFKEEDASGFLFWTKDKHFWIEYSGIVDLGIDASQVSMSISGDDVVTITIPEAEVLNCTVDSASLTEDSFIVDKDSADITAEDERRAFEEAQAKMEESAANDRILLSNAQQRAQTLLENYVKNIGSATQKDYKVSFSVISSNHTNPSSNEQTAEGET